MIDYTEEEDKFILQGDPAEAMLLVQSAYRLFEDFGEDVYAIYFRERCEEWWKELGRLEQLVRENTERFEIRNKYGPLTKSKLARG